MLKYVFASVICDYCHREFVGENTRQFCSRECKSESQKKRIELTCAGCEKKFWQLRYLQRDTNYCTVQCYRDTTRRTQTRKCKVCNKSFEATRTLVEKGYGIYCSRECQHREYPKRIIKFCLQCSVKISVPPSKKELVKFCSKKCNDDYRRDYVHFVCKYCKKDKEIPRWEINRGRGNFCTWDCFIKYKGESSLEEKVRFLLEKGKLNFKQEVKFGRFHVDFVIEEKKLAIECDGEFWHMRDKIRERDARKDKILKRMGYKVLRFSGQKIIKSSQEELLRLVNTT